MLTLKKFSGTNELPVGAGFAEWLYQHEVCAWLYRRELRCQLPWPFRLFGYYAKAQSVLWNGPIVGGEIVLRWAQRRDCPHYAALKTEAYTVYLNLRDARMLNVPNELLSEGPELTILKSCLIEGDTFVDLGANHGTYSIIAAKQVGPSGLVIAIEPQPNLAVLVEKSLRANATCRFEVHAVACGDHNDEVEFFIPESHSGFASIFPEFSARAAHLKLTVQLRKFDDAFAWQEFPGKIVLKVDIEGSELSFLRGATAMLRARKPDILLEVNPSSASASGNSVGAIVGLLREVGYSRFTEMKLPMQPRSLVEMDLRRGRNVLVSA
jgi:FkbM family methyltransferase